MAGLLCKETNQNRHQQSSAEKESGVVHVVEVRKKGRSLVLLPTNRFRIKKYNNETRHTERTPAQSAIKSSLENTNH